MRLDKYISNATDFSRKEVKRLLHQRVVTVDGETVVDPGRHVAAAQVVSINGEPVAAPRTRYLMLNKPAGYVCATADGEHPIVLDLLDEPNRDKLQIAGRLDIDTTGLVLITDNGKWNHAVTAPNRVCPKTYYVVTADAIADDVERKFARGVMLEGEKRRTRPARLERLFANEARLTISEGKYHQVKRMFAAVGNRVEELHRESVGAIVLDPELAEGEYRELTAEEVGSVYAEGGSDV